MIGRIFSGRQLVILKSITLYSCDVLYYSVICVHVVAKVKKWGNSVGVIIESEATKKLGLKEGELIDMDIVPKKRIDAFGISKRTKPLTRVNFEHDY